MIDRAILLLARQGARGLRASNSGSGYTPNRVTFRAIPSTRPFQIGTPSPPGPIGGLKRQGRRPRTVRSESRTRPCARVSHQKTLRRSTPPLSHDGTFSLIPFRPPSLVRDRFALSRSCRTLTNLCHQSWEVKISVVHHHRKDASSSSLHLLIRPKITTVLEFAHNTSRATYTSRWTGVNIL